jgi:hypothetical protein
MMTLMIKAHSSRNNRNLHMLRKLLMATAKLSWNSCYQESINGLTKLGLAVYLED